MENKKSIISVLLVAIIVTLAWTSTYAEEPPSEKNDWELNLAPFYLWALSI